MTNPHDWTADEHRRAAGETRAPTLPKPVSPPLVYCAAPYRAPTGWGIDCNIQRARQAGADVARLGAMPVVPHANTAHYDGLASDSFWLLGTLALLERCDAIYLVPGWERSSGARAECDYAEQHGKPIFSELDVLGAWVERFALERMNA